MVGSLWTWCAAPTDLALMRRWITRWSSRLRARTSQSKSPRPRSGAAHSWDGWSQDYFTFAWLATAAAAAAAAAGSPR